MWNLENKGKVSSLSNGTLNSVFVGFIYIYPIYIDNWKLKKTARHGDFNSQWTQNTERAAQMYSTESSLTKNPFWIVGPLEKRWKSLKDAFQGVHF